MNFFREYIFTLCTLMVIFAALFSILPPGGTKNTVKSVIGIVTALALISPFFSYRENLLLFEFSQSDELVDYDKAENMEKITLRRVEKVVEDEIKKFLERTCEVRVSVSREGIVERVEIENVTESERDFIGEKLGIDKERIKKY